MADPRVANFAKVLVEHSARIVPGDRVLLFDSLLDVPRLAFLFYLLVLLSLTLPGYDDPGTSVN